MAVPFVMSQWAALLKSMENNKPKNDDWLFSLREFKLSF